MMNFEIVFELSVFLVRFTDSNWFVWICELLQFGCSLLLLPVGRVFLRISWVAQIGFEV